MKYLLLLILLSCEPPDFVYKQEVEFTYCHRNQKDEFTVYTEGLVSNNLITIKRHKRGSKTRPKFEYDMMSTVEFYDYQKRSNLIFLDVCDIRVISYKKIKNTF